MYHKTNTATVLYVFFASLLSGAAIPIQAYSQDSLKNLPELSLPITNDKMVIAHCMTGIIRYSGHKMEDSCDPAFYSPKGNITESLGGLTQVNVIADQYLKDSTLDQAVEFEMRAALKCGIDAFQFYYILGLPAWDEIIMAYFRVAAIKNLDFKFTVCISHPNGSTEKAKINEFATRINKIMDGVGRDNPRWLRTPDGRLIVYLWLGQGLADIPKDKAGLPDEFYLSRAYRRLASATHENFACIYTINERISLEKLNTILDYFPATWVWTLAYSSDYIGNLIASESKKRNRTFTGTTFPDFYTSKLLKRGTWNMYHRAKDAVQAGIDSVERKYVPTGLSYNFRKLFEFGIAQDVSIMNIITWNDFPEGHHFAPEVNHNYGFSVLLNYYKAIWKGEASPYQDRDVAIAFFKKYKHSIKPVPYNIPVVHFQEEPISENEEDSIEVITLLKQAGTLKVNGVVANVSAGLFSTRFEQKKGPVDVAIFRNKKQTVGFVTPEGITDRPYRTDRLTYCYSSECIQFHKAIFGNKPPVHTPEYNSTWSK